MEFWNQVLEVSSTTAQRVGLGFTGYGFNNLFIEARKEPGYLLFAIP